MQVILNLCGKVQVGMVRSTIVDKAFWEKRGNIFVNY